MITFQISDKVFQNNPELQDFFCTQKNTSESTLQKNNNLHVLLGVSVTAFPEAKGKRETQ
jgi:hypothetical protein